jgi:hypothetical protein
MCASQNLTLFFWTIQSFFLFSRFAPLSVGLSEQGEYAMTKMEVIDFPIFQLKKINNFSFPFLISKLLANSAAGGNIGRN